MIWYAKFDNRPPQDTARFFCIFHSGFTNLHHAMMRTRCCFRKPKQEYGATEQHRCPGIHKAVPMSVHGTNRKCQTA
jgi:hypothetical protein